MTLLETRFFLNFEERKETDIRAHYHDARTAVVEFAHSKTGWREIHTGLTIFIAELSILIESATDVMKAYGQRLIEISKGLIRQIELAVTAKVDMGNEAGSDVPAGKEQSNAVFTGKYSDLVEVIFLFLEANFINGGSRHSRSYIIRELHRLAGLEYDAKKFHNAKNGIERRCPAEGCRVTYFLDEIIDKTNARLAA